jgi:hypothetical protein
MTAPRLRHGRLASAGPSRPSPGRPGQFAAQGSVKALRAAWTVRVWRFRRRIRASYRGGDLSLPPAKKQREWMGIEPTWNLFDGFHNGFEARGRHQAY